MPRPTPHAHLHGFNFDAENGVCEIVQRNSANRCAWQSSRTQIDWRSCSLSITTNNLHKILQSHVRTPEWYHWKRYIKSFLDKGKCTISQSKKFAMFLFLHLLLLLLLLFILPYFRVEFSVNGTCCSRIVRCFVTVLYGAAMVVWVCEPKRWIVARTTSKHRRGRGNNSNKIEENKIILYFIEKKKIFAGSFLLLCANYKWSNKWCGELMQRLFIGTWHMEFSGRSHFNLILIYIYQKLKKKLFRISHRHRHHLFTAPVTLTKFKMCSFMCVRMTALAPILWRRRRRIYFVQSCLKPFMPTTRNEQ